MSINNELLKEIVKDASQLLMRLEYDYNLSQGIDMKTKFLFSHSLRVANLSKYISEREGIDPIPIYIAALFHDVGKFIWKKDSKREEAREEEISAEYAVKVLKKHKLDKSMISLVESIILGLYSSKREYGEGVAILHDADALDKAGFHGVYTFISKWTIRGDDLESIIFRRLPAELTYLHNLDRIVITNTARELAKVLKKRAMEYYQGLISELKIYGYRLVIKKETYEGIEIIYVTTDKEIKGIKRSIQKRIKCNWVSLNIRYIDEDEQEFGLCLPET